MNKEQIYDEQISPLMAQIIAICKENKIAHFCSFSLSHEDDEGLMCTTGNISEEFEPPEVYEKIWKMIYPGQQSPLMITTRDGDGKVTRVDAVFG